jgi:hypothetical protein
MNDCSTTTTSTTSTTSTTPAIESSSINNTVLSNYLSLINSNVTQETNLNLLFSYLNSYSNINNNGKIKHLLI